MIKYIKYPNTIDYLVYDDINCGIYNGFNIYDPAVIGILNDTGLRDFIEIIYDPYGIAIEAIKCYDLEPLPELMKWYEPLPIEEDLYDDCKKMMLKRIENKTAPGYCHVPYETAKKLIINNVNNALRKLIKNIDADKLEKFIINEFERILLK